MPETYRRYEERDVYYEDDEPPPRRAPPPRRGPPPPRDEEIIYERREERRTQSPGPIPMPRRSAPEVAVREREEITERESRVPHFLREEARRSEAGPLVLRQRDIETVERSRPRPRSPSPVVRERIITKTRARSVSPGPPPPPPPEIREEIRTRIVDHSRERVRSPSRGPALDRVRLGTRFIERPERSPSPPPQMERIRTRVIERERSPSPASSHAPSHAPSLHPGDIERSRIRVIERHERPREPTPSPSPPPPPSPPPVIRGPTIEREVITHYRDIDHGLIQARPPSPPPPPRKIEKREVRETRETDIDIYRRGDDTEIDITNSRSRSRPRPRSVSRERPPPRSRAYYHEDEVVVSSGRDKLKVDIEHEHRSSSSRPRAHSAAPDYEDEAERITGRISSRGGMGEAWGGRTKDWTVVDVPPGTEKVRMDGAGGGAAEVVWERYSGARKAKFISERASESALVPASPPTSSSTTISAERDYAPPRTERDHLSVEIYNKGRERDVEVEKVTDRRISIRPSLPPPAPAPLPRPKDMWTEVTKDLVTREAIEECGYEYEETESFFYVMQYLKYEDVLELVEISDRIRARRKERIREIAYEREIRDEWERERRHRSRPKWDDEKIVEREREVIYDRPRRY